MSKGVDWYYLRKGWTTCTKASKFLEANNISIKETALASRKLQSADCQTLMDKANKLIALKGKKIAEFDLKSESSTEALAAMLGPTGNMRAPTLQLGKTLIVGFNEEVFTSQFS